MKTVFKKKNKQMRMSISKKIIAIYIAFVFMPACTLLYFYYIKSSSIIETEVTESALETLRQSSINISNVLENVLDVSDRIFLDPRVQQFLVSEYDNIGDQVDEAKEMRKIFDSFKNMREPYRVRMFLEEEKMISQEKVTFFSIKDLEEKDWYKDVLNSRGGIYWKGTYQEKYIDTGEANIISCARILKHSFNYYENKGVLLIDLPESAIWAILSEINLSKEEGIFVIDQEGKVISHADKSLFGTQMIDSVELTYVNSYQSGIQKVKKEGKDIFLLHQTIGITGWKIIATINREDIIHTNTIFNNLSTFMLILITFIAFVTGIFLLLAHIVTDMNKQIRNLIDVIHIEGMDLLEEGAASYIDGDLTELEKNVYYMMKKAKAYMEESLQARLREREAQLKALQAQINPHFLYNTLDTINWMAIKLDAGEISTMVNSLARYFRLSLSKGEYAVSIKDEIELAKAYLAIQQMRFKGAIQSEFIVENDLKAYKMPKLTLQPIIENAILHGIQKKQNRSGKIRVEVKKIKETIYFSITDDGIGMEERITNNILHTLPDEKHGSYGLYNVNERIKLYFGNEYGVSISSKVGIGTRVEITIKAI